MTVSSERITPTQLKKAKFVEGVFMGMEPKQAAIHAGYNPTHASHTAHSLLRDPWVAEHIQQVANVRVEKAISKADVESIVVEAVDIARMKGEPGDMIRGASELAKLNGYYAPEKKEVSIDAEMRIKRMEVLSDTELLEMLGAEPAPIEAEFERLDGKAEVEKEEPQP
jgi:phage terminase small subunit